MTDDADAFMAELEHLGISPADLIKVLKDAQTPDNAAALAKAEKLRQYQEDEAKRELRRVSAEMDARFAAADREATERDERLRREHQAVEDRRRLFADPEPDMFAEEPRQQQAAPGAATRHGDVNELPMSFVEYVHGGRDRLGIGAPDEGTMFG